VPWIVIVQVTEADGEKEITGVFGFDTEPEALAWSEKADETWKPRIPTTFLVMQVSDGPLFTPVGP